jgi:hypothetical protein
MVTISNGMVQIFNKEKEETKKKGMDKLDY